jgi:hypothetical protein
MGNPKGLVENPACTGQQLIPGHTTFASEKGLYGVWPGIRNEKNQRSAAGLYIAPGFAHMRS